MRSNDHAFAERLRSALTRRGWTQRRAAEAAGLTVTALQNYLAGRLPQPTQAKNLAAALEVPLSWLLDGAGDVDQLSLVNSGRPGLSSASFDVLEAREEFSAHAGTRPSLDIEAAEFVLGRSLERAAPQFGATPSEVQAWRAGADPTLEQMVRLTNLVLFIATDGRLNLKVPSECPSSTPAVEESRHQLTGT